MSRSTKEIVDRIKAIEGEDMLFFEIPDLIHRLPFSDAKPWLNDDAKEGEWGIAANDRESILKEMQDYMPFAWDKANNCRGISASRSLCHMRAWLWLIDELANFENIADDYDYYGKPQLAAICEKFGWDWTQWDDDHWRRSEYDDGISADQARAA